MRAWRDSIETTPGDVDQELRAALDVVPSPDFNARVRIRIAEEGAKAGWFRPWMGLATAASVITIAVAVFQPWTEPTIETSDGDHRTQQLSSTPGPPAPPAVQPAASRLVPINLEKPRARGVTRDEPAVLVAASERRGMHRLSELLNSRDEGLNQLLAAAPDPSIEIVEIPTVAIVPVVLPTVTIERVTIDTQ